MKKSGALIASVAAASATAISSSSSDLFHSPMIHPSTKEVAASREDRDVSRISSSSTEKFAPKFDGLRFIETLVTAHR